MPWSVRASVTPIRFSPRRGHSDSGSRSSSIDEDRRTIGVLLMSHRGGQRQAFYFRLRREYDRTGTFNLGEDHNFKMVRTPREKSQ